MGVPTSCAEAALDELCRVHGYCRAREEQETILAGGAEDLDAFVDAVLVAEGLDPVLIDEHQRRQVRDVVCDWLFDDGAGRGTKSGLPRLTSPG